MDEESLSTVSEPEVFQSTDSVSEKAWFEECVLEPLPATSPFDPCSSLLEGSLVCCLGTASARSSRMRLRNSRF